MSLLETRNKKFNLPIVFIVGTLFLIGLAYFANYLENLSQEAKNVAVQKDTSEKIITVRIQENKIFNVDGTKIDIFQLEEELKKKFDAYANPVVVIEIPENIPFKNTQSIMEIVTKYNHKAIFKAVSN